MASQIGEVIRDLVSKSPTVLALCDQYIKDEGCKQLRDALISNNTVHTLDLRGNDIQHAGAQCLAELIQQNTFITTLKLEWNLLGHDASLSTLCSGLSNSRVQRLDLRNNKIGGSGGKILAKMLASNASLYHLDLRWNNLGLVGGQCILDHLNRCKVDGNFTLSECLLSGNQIPVQILRSIDSILSEHKQRASQRHQIRVVSTDTKPIHVEWTNNKSGTSILEDTESVDIYTEDAGTGLNVNGVDSLDRYQNKDGRKDPNSPHYQSTSELVGTDRMQSTLKSKNESIEALQEEINDLFETKSSLRDENEAMKIKIAELESRLLDLSDKYEILENEKKTITQNASDSSTQYIAERKETASKIKNLEMKLEESVTKREGDKLEFDRLHQTMKNDFKMKLDELRETKDAELSASRQRISDLHLEINELKTINNDLRSAVLEKDMESERKCIAFEQKVRTECNESLGQKMTDLERNIAIIKSSRDELEHEMSTEKEKYTKLIESVENEKVQFQQWLKEEQKAKSELETEKRMLSMNIQKYTNVITQKNQQIESLKIGLKETQKSIKGLETEHHTSMQRVLTQHNRQILTLEKSLRETEQRLTICEHRKRNLELRIVRIEDEEQRKSAAVHDAVKTLSNVFVINSNLLNSTVNATPSFSEAKQSKGNGNKSMGSSRREIKIEEGDDDGSETIIEIIDDDEDDGDFMRDHNTFNKRKKKKNKKKSSKHLIKS